jgi:hypothetical protein
MAEDTNGEGNVNVPASAKKVVETYGSSLVGLWLGAALIVLGSFMTWAKVGGFSASGFDDNGEITLLAGLVIAGVGLLPYLKQVSFKLSKQAGYWVVIVSAFISGYFVSNAASDVKDAGDALNTYGNLFGAAGKTSVGLGIWVVLLGGLIALIAVGLMNLGQNVKSVDEVKKMSKANQKFVFVPAGLYLLMFLVFYI